MALFTFNQANGTLLSAISATWAGDVSSLEVQSSVLIATGGNPAAAKNAYLNESGSTYAISKVTAGTSNIYRMFICSSSGTYLDGYTFYAGGTNATLLRNNTSVGSWVLPGGLNINGTNTEIKIEKVGSNINLYAGPIGSPVSVGTYTDGAPISSGFSGIFTEGGGTTTPGVISFDNGVVPYTYASAFSRGMFRGIDRGTA